MKPPGPNLAEYEIQPLERDFSPPGEPALWQAVPALTIDNYLWLDNGYQVFEKRVRIQYLEFQDPVWKDSCVEFFIDPFPEKERGYINIETNAAGAMLIAFGPDRETRTPIPREDLPGLEIATSVQGRIEGEHGADYWTLSYRLPLGLFEKYYGSVVTPGRQARANFYKCGDEIDPPHFGAWNPVLVAEPDFHRPEFFGRVLFL
jgi:hypothetical protein